MDHGDHAPEQCNNDECRALHEVGAHVKRAAFTHIPASDDFASSLKARLRAGRQEQSISMKQGLWSRVRDLVMIQPRMFAMALAVILIFVLVGTLLIPRGGNGPRQVVDIFITPTFAQDNFEVIPTQGVGVVVDRTTEFLVKSKTPLELKQFEKSIVLTPTVAFTVKQLSPNEFRVIPKKSLEDKTVYEITINAAYQGEQQVTVERDFSWAFQVKDTLKAVSTLPGNRSVGVPLDTGIEITFSHDKLVEPEKSFHIEPAVEGRFEYHGRTIVFVPKALQPGTVYTVTFKKGVQSTIASPLVEDYRFQFETANKGRQDLRWGIQTQNAMFEFTPKQPVVLPVWTYSEDTTDVTVSVSAFKNVTAFEQALQRKTTAPQWSVYAKRQIVVEPDQLTKVRDYTLPFQRYKYNYYLVFPDTLPTGYYLLDVQRGGERDQILVQVTNLASFVSVTDNRTVVWVHSLDSGEPVKGARVTEPKTKQVALTNDEGIALFDTKQLFTSEEVDHLVISQGNNTLVLTVDSSRGEYSSYSSVLAQEKYWTHTSLDRPLYQPNDTIRFWGFVKPREGSLKETQVTVSLRGVHGWIDAFGEASNGTITDQTVAVKKQGFFDGALVLPQVTPGYYSVEMRLGDDVVGLQYITVETYKKPAYEITMMPRKKALFAGEQAIADITTKFFEGTPVVGMEIAYQSGWNWDQNGQESGTVKTDAAGKAVVTLPTTAMRCTLATDSCYLNPLRIAARPASAEEASISEESYVRLFAAGIDGDVDVRAADNLAHVSSTFYTLDLAPLNNDTFDDDAEYRRSRAAARPIQGRVRETTYVKRETGQYYDFINKRTQKTYMYDRIEKDILDFNGVTDMDGRFTYEFPVESDKSYRVFILAEDTVGRTVRYEQYAYTENNYRYDSDYEWYSLREREDHPDGYSVGETVNLELYQRDTVLSPVSGQILYYKMKSGLEEYTVSRDSLYSFAFTEKNIPNVYVSAVWFDGKMYHPVSPGWGLQSTLVRYRFEDRALTVTVDANKKEYAPGESVTFSISTKDRDGRPHSSAVNLKLIDEAYYAIAADYISPLSRLYTTVGSGEVFAYNTHQFGSLADKNAGGAEGGCFLPGTKITMSDGSQKNIEDIAVGDLVATFADERSGELVHGSVTALQEHIVTKYLIVNGFLQITPEHRLLVNGNWSIAGNIRVGDTLRGQDGNMILVKTVVTKHALVKVYNFRVDPYHTYIADGVYVHNDKGDGGARKNFPDVALYQTVVTDNEGRATLTVTLPDSVTSWRLSAEAISQDLYAGHDITTIPVTLPFFGLTVIPDELLVGDKPIVTARGYGKALRDTDTVNVTMLSPLIAGGKQEAAGKAFQAIPVSFQKAPLGLHMVTTTLVRGDNRDTIVEPVHVVSSRLTRTVQHFLTLPLQGNLPGNTKGLTKLIVTDEGRGKLYYRLLGLTCECGDRIDQKIGRVVGPAWFGTYFGEKDASGEKIDVSAYQDGKGGIRLLTYGDPELLLTAKVTALAPEAFDRSALHRYFHQVIVQKEVNREEAALALWGLAALDEPVLPMIRSLGEDKELKSREKMFVALAAAELGDKEYARDMYQELMTQYGKLQKTTGRVEIPGQHESTVESTALMMVLAGMLDEKEAPLLQTFIDDHRWSSNKVILTNLEELLYVKHVLPTLPKEDLEFTIKRGTKIDTVRLSKGNSYTLQVKPSDLSTLAVTPVRGTAAAVSAYQAPVAGGDIQTSPNVSIDRKYFVGGVETNKIKTGDLVEVRLYPRMSNTDGGWGAEVTDVVPSGLRFTPEWYYVSERYNECGYRYPFEINGQVLKFFWTKGTTICSNYISYYARVVAAGEYGREPALIQSLRDPESMNVGGDLRTIMIEQ